jgi:hypothetical protein
MLSAFAPAITLRPLNAARVWARVAPGLGWSAAGRAPTT